jgi:hypothetical protein
MHLGRQKKLKRQIVYKHLEGIVNNIRTWINGAVSLLVAIVIAGCGGGESAPIHAPGEIERLPNATIYHLKDGVFIHEVFEGADHYYLVDDYIVKSCEPTQEGLSYVKKNGNAGVAQRASVGEILGVLRDSDSRGLVTSLRGDEATIKRVIEGFNADATVESMRNLTRRPTAQHVASFIHSFPDAGSGGSTNYPTEGQPFYGFDGENFSSITRLTGKETEVKFQFKLASATGGKDIYEITRTVIDRNGVDGPVTTESAGQPVTVTVEYAGKELIVFDDEHGVAKFVPAPKVEPKQSTSSHTQQSQTRKPGQP